MWAGTPTVSVYIKTIITATKVSFIRTGGDLHTRLFFLFINLGYGVSYKERAGGSMTRIGDVYT